MSSYGELPYGGELPPWRAIIEADGGLTADGATSPPTNPKVQVTAPALQEGALLSAPAGVAQAGAAMPQSGDISAAPGALGATSVPLLASGDISSGGFGVVEATASMVQDGSVAPAALMVGASRTVVTAIGDSDGTGGAMALSSPVVTAQSDGSHIVSSFSENPPLLDPQPPQLLPLVFSHEVDEVEAELKELFITLFEVYMRPAERYVNALGTPHLGSRELIENALASDGLSIYRGATVNQDSGAYLLRSWRALNPKRGTHLLKAYLQLLWPNVWTANQMWQEKGEPYPEALTETDEGNHYLTSRINVTLPSRSTTGGDVGAIASGLRASLPARLLLNLSIVSDEGFGIGMVGVAHAAVVGLAFEGTFK